jgi:hypothetical protein
MAAMSSSVVQPVVAIILGVAEVYALVEKDGGGLQGEAAIAGNGFAYGVGIAQTKHGVFCILHK